MNLQQHIDAILSTAVFSGELYYIQHPDPTGSAAQVVQLYGVYAIVGGQDFANLEGDINVSLPRVQISVYAVDSSALVTAVAAVNTAMKAAAILAQTSSPDTTATALFNFSASVPVDGFEQEAKRFYSHMDFYCWSTN